MYDPYVQKFQRYVQKVYNYWRNIFLIVYAGSFLNKSEEA